MRVVPGPNKQMQRARTDHKCVPCLAHRRVADLRRYATLLRHALAAALTALATFAAAQEPICNPCVDGPEMFEHRRIQAPRNPRADAPSAYALDAPFVGSGFWQIPCPADLKPIVHPSPEFRRMASGTCR
jgi:hypothetical protein